MPARFLPSQALRRSPEPRRPRRRRRRAATRLALLLGTFASTKRSCTFLRRPASRSPGRRVRTTSSGTSDLEPPGAEVAPGPRAARVSYSRTRADTRAEVGRLRPCAEESSSASVRSSALGRRGRSSASASRFRSAPGCRRRSSGRISSRIRPRFVSGLEESARKARPCSRQYASVSSRQSESSGRTTPSSRAGLDSLAVAGRDEPIEDRLDLIRGRVAGRAQPASLRQRIAEITQLGLGRAW